MRSIIKNIPLVPLVPKLQRLPSNVSIGGGNAYALKAPLSDMANKQRRYLGFNRKQSFRLFAFPSWRGCVAIISIKKQALQNALQAIFFEF